MYPNLPEWLARIAESERGFMGLLFAVLSFVCLLAAIRFFRSASWPWVRELSLYGVMLALAAYVLLELL